MTSRPPVQALIADLVDRLGRPAYVVMCTDLLAGAPRERYAEHLPALTAHAGAFDADLLDSDRWRDYWVRTWGARGLLHVWDEIATAAVVEGLRDEHWRPAEMCLKVVARHDVAGAGDGAAALVGHDLARVREQALRALAVVGDSEHAEVVSAALDDEHPDVRRQAGRAQEAMARRLDLTS